MELDLNDFSSFIPTNLMGMTDGHLLFKSALASQGNRPAVDVSLSVTRVGRQTQNRVQELLSTKIRQTLAQAGQLETLGQFSFELPPETQALFKQAKQIKELLKQPPDMFITKEAQTILLALPYTKWMAQKDVEYVEKNKVVLIGKIPQTLLDEVFDLPDDNALITKLDDLGEIAL
jgi:F-type H+/Na+-transporting ATPase subunit alpha